MNGSTRLLGAAPVITPAICRTAATLLSKVANYVNQRTAEFDQIDGRRKEVLERVANFILEQVKAVRPVRLLFICTHNSRRSHLGQVWARVAAERVGIKVETYSGGTETTAFNPRSVAALARAGLLIDVTTEDDNPIYHVRYAENRAPITCFSKIHNQPPNPTRDHAAIMVCGDADEACPVVEGAAVRIALPYADPKSSDGTADEAAKYDERGAEIAREMSYVFDVAARQLTRPQ